MTADQAECRPHGAHTVWRSKRCIANLSPGKICESADVSKITCACWCIWLLRFKSLFAVAYVWQLEHLRGVADLQIFRDGISCMDRSHNAVARLA